MAKHRRYALSIKQPWAALLVHGLKKIEVRAWSTARRGVVLLHAASIPDPRPEGWRLLPARLKHEAEWVGGIIGCAVLADCVVYRTAEEFRAAQAQHLNHPSWFRPPQMYGFEFTAPATLPFRRYPGWMRFFPINDSET